MSLCLQPIDFKFNGWITSSNSNNEPVGFNCGEGILNPSIENLTTKKLNGNGAFDILMRATKLHLKREYDAQRITGKQYTEVYLGTMQAVMQTSVQYLLNQQEVNKINAEIGLIRQKTVSELALTDDSIPIGLGFNHYEDDSCIDPIVCGGSSCNGSTAFDTEEASLAKPIIVANDLWDLPNTGEEALVTVVGGDGCFTTFTIYGVETYPTLSYQEAVGSKFVVAYFEYNDGTIVDLIPYQTPSPNEYTNFEIPDIPEGQTGTAHIIVQGESGSTTNGSYFAKEEH